MLKSEQEHARSVINELIEHLEVQKKHALITNLHIEAYIPFQIISHSYDLIRVLAAKRQLKKELRKEFTRKVTEYEQNLLNCCNPEKFG
jgi:hypothetical protein